MKIATSDTIIEYYKEKIEQQASVKTSGLAIPFSVYKDSIIEVSYISEDIAYYHIQKQVLDYLELVSK